MIDYAPEAIGWEIKYEELDDSNMPIGVMKMEKFPNGTRSQNRVFV